MERVTLDAVDPEALPGGGERRRLTDPLGTTDVAVNHYRVPPGEGLPAGLHAHDDQAELFYVLAGEAAFEALLPRADGREAREIRVAAGEAVRFAPGEFQSGRNAGDDPLVVLALGVPRDSERFRVPLACPACDHDSLRVAVDESGVDLVCPDCNAAHVPAGCPVCGTEMRATLRDAGVGVVCPDCGHEQDDPPLA